MRGTKYTSSSDEGCSFHARCVTCPFAKCRYDYFAEGATLRAGRQDVIAEMARDGYSAEQIAEVLPGGAGDVGTIRAWMAA